ncbi:MAG: amino acid ABC transporter permease [Eubacteriales bacterium]|nr:amino acid ABC transporter permease [Eubacteriales bacterium]
MIFDLKFFAESFWAIFCAIPKSLYLTVCGFALGLVLAFLFAVCIRANVPVLKQIVQFLISVMRGTPTILQIYIAYYVIPIIIVDIAGLFGKTMEQSDIPVALLVIFALGFNRAGYLAETIRSGLAAVSKAELEAAHSIGLSTLQTLRFVILPQTIRICLPNFSTNLINILHASSLAFYVTLIEMTGTANLMAEDNWKYFESFVAVGLLYWAITALIEVLTHLLENRLSRHEKMA